MVDSPISSFYHTVRKVFAPLLLEDERWSKHVDPKLQRLLGHLESGLAASLRSSDVSIDESPNPDALSIIFSPLDEYNYWKEMESNLPTRQQQNRAKFFSNLMTPFQTSFGALERKSFNEFKDSLEVSLNILDDLWRQDEHSPGFPADRMANLMDIIGNSTVNFIQIKMQ
ncbi:Cytoplasmic dynein 2 heavy chain 1, partial [Stegodyphus mimosarum]